MATDVPGGFGPSKGRLSHRPLPRSNVSRATVPHPGPPGSPTYVAPHPMAVTLPPIPQRNTGCLARSFYGVVYANKRMTFSFSPGMA